MGKWEVQEGTVTKRETAGERRTSAGDGFPTLLPPWLCPGERRRVAWRGETDTLGRIKEA